jgi:hypothetical protein
MKGGDVESHCGYERTIILAGPKGLPRGASTRVWEKLRASEVETVRTVVADFLVTGNEDASDDGSGGGSAGQHKLVIILLLLLLKVQERGIHRRSRVLPNGE